jgi:mannose-6-phosphate isomerase class I
MIIALTNFEALCDFRPIDDIKKSLSDVSELAACVGKDWESLTLRDWFTNLMKCDPGVVKQQLLALKVIEDLAVF